MNEVIQIQHLGCESSLAVVSITVAHWCWLDIWLARQAASFFCCSMLLGPVPQWLMLRVLVSSPPLFQHGEWLSIHLDFRIWTGPFIMLILSFPTILISLETLTINTQIVHFWTDYWWHPENKRTCVRMKDYGNENKALSEASQDFKPVLDLFDFLWLQEIHFIVSSIIVISDVNIWLSALLASFMSTWHKLKLPEEGDPHWENAPRRSSYRAFS